MAVNRKKEKNQSPSVKEANSARPWPDLPRQLINLIGKKPALMDGISFGGTSKTWRTAPRQCNPAGKTPWLQLSTGEGDGRCKEWHGRPHPHFFIITVRRGEYWPYPSRGVYECPEEYFVGYSHGVLVTLCSTPSECKYRYAEGSAYSRLPPWDANIPIKRAAPITKPLWFNACVLVLTGISSPAFLFYKPGVAREWIKQDCIIVDPHSPVGSQPRETFMRFTSAIGFEGKFYALSLQGTLAVIEETDSGLGITSLGRSRAIPSAPSRHFREHLVESDGEILLVFLISRKWINVVDDVEVFSLDPGNLSWIKMENLGNRTLFVGADFCMPVHGSRVGYRSNCLFFTQLNDEGWWVYEMGTGTILPSWNRTDSTTKSPVWIEPREDEQE